MSYHYTKPMLTRLFLLVFVSTGALAKPACMQAVTSIEPIALAVEQIYPGQVCAHALYRANGSPHNIAISMADVRKVTAADVFIYTDRNLEAGFDKLAEKAPRAVELATWVDRAVLAQVHADKEQHEGHAHEEGSHLFLDPVLTFSSIQRSQFFSTESASGRQTTAQFDITPFAQRLAPFKASQYLVYHAGYGEFAARFGLTHGHAVKAVPDAPLGLKRLAELKKEIKHGAIACLLADESERDSAEKVANKLAIPVVYIDLLAVKADYKNYSDYIDHVVTQFEACFTKG